MIFEVAKDALATTRLEPDPAPALAPRAGAAAGGRLRPDARTTSPTPCSARRCSTGTSSPPPSPRCGVASRSGASPRSIETTSDACAVGERLYGYLPMGSELVIEPGRGRRARPRRPGRPPCTDGERRTTATRVAPTDPGYDAAREAQQMLLYPLFYTSFVVDDFFEDQDDFGTDVTILSSASSKTAIGIAFLAHRRGRRVVGLTSAHHRDFVAGLGVYDEVVLYGDARADGGTAVYVDMSGNLDVRHAVHAAYGDRLAHSMVVGDTHWDHDAATAGRAARAPAPSSSSPRPRSRSATPTGVGPSWTGAAPRRGPPTPTGPTGGWSRPPRSGPTPSVRRTPSCWPAGPIRAPATCARCRPSVRRRDRGGGSGADHGVDRRSTRAPRPQPHRGARRDARALHRGRPRPVARAGGGARRHLAPFRVPVLRGSGGAPRGRRSPITSTVSGTCTSSMGSARARRRSDHGVRRPSGPPVRGDRRDRAGDPDARRDRRDPARAAGAHRRALPRADREAVRARARRDAGAVSDGRVSRRSTPSASSRRSTTTDDHRAFSTTQTETLLADAIRALLTT